MGHSPNVDSTECLFIASHLSLDQEKGQPSEESVGDVDGDDKDLGDDDDDGNEMEGAVGFDKG